VKILCIFAVAVLAGAAAIAQLNPPAGGAVHPEASLAHDQHEGLTISADPYNDPKRAKEKFGNADPVPVGLLPVEVFLRNETLKAIRINMETVQLDIHSETGSHEQVDWLPVQEVARMIAHPKGPSNPHAPRFPIGIQTGADSKTDKMIEMLRPFALDADVIPPMGMLHGFLFFDVNHDLSLANHASLYVPDLTNVPDKKPLMFFEVTLGK
jgi:hypothetical protein